MFTSTTEGAGTGCPARAAWSRCSSCNILYTVRETSVSCLHKLMKVDPYFSRMRMIVKDGSSSAACACPSRLAASWKIVRSHCATFLVKQQRARPFTLAQLESAAGG